MVTTSSQSRERSNEDSGWRVYAFRHVAHDRAGQRGWGSASHLCATWRSKQCPASSKPPLATASSKPTDVARASSRAVDAAIGGKPSIVTWRKRSEERRVGKECRS